MVSMDISVKEQKRAIFLNLQDETFYIHLLTLNKNLFFFMPGFISFPVFILKPDVIFPKDYLVLLLK